MEDYELTLFDRIEVIKKTVDKYGIDKFYISFSGGKDSTVLHYLIDEALPGNKIPRVFFNTGIEYNHLTAFVKELATHDDRIVIYNSNVNIPKMLEENGYPFKSKQFAKLVATHDNNPGAISVELYLKGIKKDGTKSKYRCPNKLRYLFETDKADRLKISHKCCDKLKKDTARRFKKETKKSIAMLGTRQAEKGARQFHSGCIAYRNKKVESFKPLTPCSDDWMEWYINSRGIELCKLYSAPYNMTRTGCKGCPFALNLAQELDQMADLLPAERKQCEIIWKPVYDEYRRLGYRKMQRENQDD